jgi:hypothetical protein
MRKVKTIATVLAALAAWLLPATVAQAAPPAPAWALKLTAVPTNLIPGTTGKTNQAPVYLLNATNVGAAPTSGTITYSITLPAGLTPKAAGGANSDTRASAPTCKITGQTATCTTSEAVNPSRHLLARAGVEVSSSLIPGETLPDATALISGGGAAPVTASAPTMIDNEPPPFGFLAGSNGLSALLTNPDGSPTTQAGGHPDQLTIDIGFPIEQASTAGTIYTNAGHPRDIVNDLPRGLIVNPQAAAQCTEVELLNGGVGGGAEDGCPDDSQVGIASVVTQLGSGPQPVVSNLYNMAAPPGSPATLSFNAARIGVYVHLEGGVRSDGDYGLMATSADTLARFVSPILDVEAQLWGDPTSSSHDQIRGACVVEPAEFAPCQVDPKNTAFLTMPSECTDSLVFGAKARSWEESEEGIEGLPHSIQEPATDTQGNAIGVSGCSQQSFEPTISAKPTTNLADSPSGLDVTLHQPQDQRLGHIAPANLKDATVTLPEGLVVNPAQADGLQACSLDQIGYMGDGRYSKDPATCPDAAKVGRLEVTTPLLDHPLPGSVYIAEPFENEFGSLLAIYLSIDDPASGTIAKLAGEVIPDPKTGQLTTRFEENPQLPLEDVTLHLFGGARGALITPFCGTHTTNTDLVPWSTPEGEDAHPTDSFAITGSPNGGSCPGSEDQAPNSPSFSAGTVLPQAGAYTPFVLKLSRNDATQRLTGFEATLPPGLTGKLAGVAECSEAQIAQAIARRNPEEGRIEQESPSCPAASEVGTVDAAAGAGPTPFHTAGHAYLAGPYKGAPLSMVVVTPAVAGPFDLGTVVVRAALHVDPITAQIHAISDPFPTILHGIPLDLRSVTVEMGRPQFTLNPTSCERFQITGNATSSLGLVSGLVNPFQVGGCSGLEFEPQLKLAFKGGTRRTKHPALKSVLTYPKVGSFANIARAAVILPKSQFIDQAHIGNPCTRPQFAAQACPKISILGRARAWTPLLDQPLEGNVYFRSNGGERELPDIVVDLRGKIRVELVGAVDTVRSRIRTTFFQVPDAPVSRFQLQLKGGKDGVLVNSENLCSSRQRAGVKLTGQNGAEYQTRPKVTNQCGKKKRKAKRGASHRRSAAKK